MQLFILLLILILILIIGISLTFILITLIFSLMYSAYKGAPYISNDLLVINESLKLANTSPQDILIDLGSGDGRVLFEAVEHFNVKKAIGYEISPWPYLISKLKCKFIAKNNRRKIYILKKSLLNGNFDECTIIYCYLLPKMLKKISKKMYEAKMRNCKLRIISPVFSIEGLTPIKTKKSFHRGFKKKITIYLY